VYVIKCPKINFLLISIYLWLYSPLNIGRFFSFLILYRVCRTPWTVNQSVAQTQNKRTQTSSLLVGIEPTIPEFELTKTVHASDRAATVIGIFSSLLTFKHTVGKGFLSNRIASHFSSRLIQHYVGLIHSAETPLWNNVRIRHSVSKSYIEMGCF
jgi:hypothetical protein